MKLKRARIGEKFVFTDEPGVWEKMPDGKAKMVFGKRDEVGKMVDINQESYVYVIFEGKGQKPKEEPKKKEIVSQVSAMPEEVQGDGITVIFLQDDKPIVKYKGVSEKRVSIMSSMDFVRIQDNGKVYMVTDRGFDVQANEVQFEVTETEVG